LVAFLGGSLVIQNQVVESGGARLGIAVFKGAQDDQDVVKIKITITIKREGN
jgi:hypothetical protein